MFPACKISLKNILVTFIKASIIVLVFLTGMEVTARIDDLIKYNAPFFGEYTASRLRRSDQDGIRCNVPNSRFEKWKINTQGFRGPDFAKSKPVGVQRIVCMGTSETFGLYESPGKEWPSQLAALLKKEKRYEVINTSVVGLELRRYKAYLSKYVLKFQPDIVILMVNPFAYAAGKYAPKNKSTVYRNKNSVTHAYKKRKVNSKIMPAGISSDLRVFPKIKQTIKQTLPPDIVLRYQAWNMKRQVRNIEKKRLNGSEPEDKIRSENIAIFKKDLSDLIHYLNENKIKVVLCSYPVLISEGNITKYPAIFNDHRRFYVELSLRGLINAADKFNQAIKEIAEIFDIEFVDLEREIPKDNKHFGDNVHYTDIGAKIVAQKIEIKIILMLNN